MARCLGTRGARNGRRRGSGHVITCVALGAIVLLLSHLQRQQGSAALDDTGAQSKSDLTFIQARHRPGPAPRSMPGRQVATSSVIDRVDASYNPAWVEAEENDVNALAWAHPQSLWAAVATAIYAFDMTRFVTLTPPTALEALAVIVVYIGLYCSRLEEVKGMEKHYQISFYASCGWTFYAAASLVHALAYSPNPIMAKEPAEALHSWAGIVYLGSCLYFYSYHWGRQVRHVLEGRFRPLFAAGLASLTFVHGLTVGHVLRMLDDPKWYETILKIYPKQWQWIADTRLAELYLTALVKYSSSDLADKLDNSYSLLFPRFKSSLDEFSTQLRGELQHMESRLGDTLSTQMFR
eukprot:TRINITY_DN8610_c0_g1_i4.p1 TRINITY_DN8610_c0_g1~~TRINITY_DN8610_c0_g1_i4.p1  ORF type:complete len:374 (-),score=54.11 TRINITY_DN8610_c0_g1_i4:851-1903(-)